jgi:hypothetical protein
MNTATKTLTNTITLTATNTATYTFTRTKTFTPTITFTPTKTFTNGPTFTFTKTATISFTPTKTLTPTYTPTKTATVTPTNTTKALFEVADIGLQNGQTTPAQVSTNNSSLTVKAFPNPSFNGQPIQFQLNLSQPAGLKLSLFAISGELVYKTFVQGSEGFNDLTWKIDNQSGTPVASGLYIYLLEITTDSGKTIKTGKIAVVR